MERGRRVALGMSGGVDSAVSAALLARAGCEVMGVTCVFQRDEASARSVRDAAATCCRLGVEHVVRDCTRLFSREVVEPFVRSYAQGLTPSPCVGCNARAKVPALFQAADEAGCTHVATGHYARIAQVLPPGDTGTEDAAPVGADAPADGAPPRDGMGGAVAAPGAPADVVGAAPAAVQPDARLAVLTALDARKDQSYMLALLSQEQLARLVLPLGGMTKAEVRMMAADLGLEVAERPDSQDICFIEGDYRPFLQAHGVRDAPGPIVDRAGRVLGTHAGLSGYTVGQRKGIGVAGPEPYYVLEKRAAENTLVVGFADEARIGGVVVGGMNWQGLAGLGRPLDAMVKLRYRSEPAACIMEPMEDGRVHVRLRSLQPTTAPGQYAVFYRGATVLGGGAIEEVLA